VQRILVIDVGNTSTSVALAEGRRLRHVSRLPTHGPNGSPAAMAALARRRAGRRRLDGAVLCSVVPARDAAWLRALRPVCTAEPIRVTHRSRLGVSIEYPRPATIGADRLANACAAWNRYHEAVIVADFGTALTFDVISQTGAYLGGIICPGLPLMTDYLAEKTALLPHIRLEGRFGAIGRSTREAMRIGALVGYRGMIRELYHHVRAGLRARRVRFCATGGYAARAVRGLGMPVAVEPCLTLEGLILIHELNTRKEGAR
jgi:type III pantothenate kinase